MKDTNKMTEVGEIPSDWQITILDDLLDLLTDFEANGSFADVKKNVIVNDLKDYAWYVRATDLENKKKMSEVKYVSESSYNYLKKTKLNGDELLITKRGEIGKVYYFEKDENQKATLAPNLYLLKLNNKVIPKYLYYYFKSEFGNKTLKKIDASTTLGALYKNDVKNLKIPLPRKIEQEAIVSIILAVDKKIEIIDSRIIQTEELKKGLMHKLLTKGIDHSRYKESPLGLIPETWEYFRLDEITEIKVGKDLMERNFSPNQSKEYKFPVYSNTVSNKGLYGYYNIEEYSGDSVTVIGRGVGVGKAFPRKGSFGAIGRLVVLFPFSNLNAIYLSYTINFCVSFFSENSAIPQLTGAQIAKYKIAVPPFHEQKKIAIILTTVDEKLAILLKKKYTYQKLKTGLMQQLLTGKIRVSLHETA